MSCREALSRHVQVYLGGRDKEELRKISKEDGMPDRDDDEQEASEGILEVKQEAIRQRVRLATIDNFQVCRTLPLNSPAALQSDERCMLMRDTPCATSNT